MENIQELKDEINQALKEVNSIPENIKIDGFNSKEFKKKTSSLLSDAMTGVKQVETVYNSLDSIREEIIKPVNKKIQKNSRNSDQLAWIGIWSGILGMVLTIFQFIPSKQPNTHREVIKHLESYVSKLDSIKYIEHEEIYIVDSKRRQKSAEYLYEDITLRGFKNVFSVGVDFWFGDEKCIITNKSPIIYFKRGNLLNLELYTSVKKYFGEQVEIKHYEDADDFVKCIFQEKEQLEIIIVV